MTIEAARDWKQPTLSATKKSHPLGNIWFRDLFLNSHENKGDGPFFSEKFLQSHGTYEDNSSSQLLDYCQLVIQPNIHFDLALEDLKAKWMMSLVDSKQGDDAHILYQISLFLCLYGWFLNS